jgi:hypothetical protein
MQSGAAVPEHVCEAPGLFNRVGRLSKVKSERVGCHLSKSPGLKSERDGGFISTLGTAYAYLRKGSNR